jgi:ATP-dependent DNA helicase PIF1
VLGGQVAAELVGGTTLHALCGIGVPRTVEDFNRMLKPEPRLRIGSCCDVLVIDEVSMLSGELLDRIEEQFRRVKQLKHKHSDADAQKPFGGVQLVLVGDFRQLSPIAEAASGGGCPHVFLNRGYAFQSSAFLRARLQCHDLSAVFRQQGDDAFVQLLGAVRSGSPSPAVFEALNARTAPLTVVPSAPSSSSSSPSSSSSSTGGQANVVYAVEPTRLYCTNVDADGRNQRALNTLPPPSWCGVSEDWAEADRMRVPRPAQERVAARLQQSSALWKSCRAGARCELRVGAQVCALCATLLGGRGVG